MIPQSPSNHYTDLVHQGVSSEAAISHAKQRFGLTAEQARFIRAHHFVLLTADQEDELRAEGVIA